MQATYFLCLRQQRRDQRRGIRFYQKTASYCGGTRELSCSSRHPLKYLDSTSSSSSSSSSSVVGRLWQRPNTRILGSFRRQGERHFTERLSNVKFFSGSSTVRQASSASASSASLYTNQDANGWTVDLDTGVVMMVRPSSSSSSSDAQQHQRFQTIIGMEIHAQLDIQHKLFSNAIKAPSSLHTPPNTCLAPFDVAIPGVLPVLNWDAVRAGILTAAALQCSHIPTTSRFERKHYMYADLPLGYQMTQQRWPLAQDGMITCRRRRRHNTPESKGKSKKKMKKSNPNAQDQEIIEEDWIRVGVDRIQLEQDSGKTITISEQRSIPRSSSSSEDNEDKEMLSIRQQVSLVDLNRAGCALVEIVSRPDIRTPRDAATVVEYLQSVLRHIGTCTGKMEEGALRCDLNVSIAPILNDDDKQHNNNSNNNNTDVSGNTIHADNPFQSDLPPGTGQRVEVKNLSSVERVWKAAAYEATRQAAIRSSAASNSTTEMEDDDGIHAIPRETRTWDVASSKTVLIRTKEDAVDYRFMPEPDVPPVVLTPERLGVVATAAADENDDDFVQQFIDANLKELPEAAAQRVQEQYGLSEYQAVVMTSDDPDAVAFYEQAVQQALKELGWTATSDDDDDELKRNQRTIHSSTWNWLCNDLFGLLFERSERQQEKSLLELSSNTAVVVDDDDDRTQDNDNEEEAPATEAATKSVVDSPISSIQLGELVAMHQEGTLSTPMGKRLLAKLCRSDVDPILVEDDSQGQDKQVYAFDDQKSLRVVAHDLGFQVITDEVELRKLCESVLLVQQSTATTTTSETYAKQWEQFKEGDERTHARIRKFFIGQLMKASNGRAHPERLQEVLDDFLDEIDVTSTG